MAKGTIIKVLSFCTYLVKVDNVIRFVHSGDLRLSQYEPAYPEVFSEESENQQPDFIVEAAEPVASSVSAKPPLGESVLKPVSVSVSPIPVKKNIYA